jgi:hypothetical protein
MKDNDLKLRSIRHDTIIETKRPLLFLGNEILDVNEIIGLYSIASNKFGYAMRDADNRNYIKYELVDMSKNSNDYSLSELVFYLCKNDSTGKVYAIKEQDMKSIIGFIRMQELIKIVNKLGYKEYKMSNDKYDNDWYIKSKACEIKLNNWTYNGLKKNPAYITALDNHQMKSDALTKQTIQHSKTLDKYIGLYRIQRNKMSAANINAWRIATTQAQKLNNQMVNHAEKYAGDYSFMPLNNLSNIDEIFSDNLGASKGVLGM